MAIDRSDTDYAHPCEADTEHDGAFSYPAEYHAFAVGVAVGMAAVLPMPKVKSFVFGLVGLGNETRSAAMKEAHHESWYALAGIVIGVLLGAAVTYTLITLGVAVFAV